MKISDGKKTVEIEIKRWNGSGYDPEGNHITVTNLLDWARKNYTLFEAPTDDIDAAAKRIQCGFGAIASSMRGVKSRKRRATSYKGWWLYRLPEEVDHEKNNNQHRC